MAASPDRAGTVGGAAGRADVATAGPLIGWTLLALGLLTGWRLVVLATNGLDLMFDEAQYWVWAQTPAFGYFSKPPLIAWLIGGFGAVCGDGEACVRAAAPLLHLATALTIGLLAHTLYGARIAAWSALTYATLPGVAFSSLLISTDVPLLFFWALALLAFVRALDSDRLAWWLLLGAALGLGLLSKYAMVLFALCVALYFVLCRDDRRHWRNPRLWLAAALAAVLIAPNIAWNAQHGFVTFGHTAANANLGGPLFRPNRLLEFVGGQFGVFGPILFALLLWLFARARRVAAGKPGALLLSFALPVLAIMTVESFLSRAHANWAAVSYVAASVLVVAWCLERGWRRLLAASLALHLAAAAALYYFDGWVGVLPQSVQSKADPFYRERGWAELSSQVGELLDANPGAVLLTDERHVLAELAYYLRPRVGVGGAAPVAAVKWNPDGVVHDHFDLATDIRDHADAAFLFVTLNYGAAHVRSQFRSAQLSADLHVPAGRKGELHYEVWRLDGWRGAGR